ncbi:MAG: 3-phosphoglycerate dehydrogenase, partial [Variovorax paradoxus]
TIGLVGLGAIGLRFARMADALGMRVIGFDPYAANLPTHVTPVDLPAIWRESDAISLHCPLTEDNRGMVNAGTLARCKRGVILVNTARGGLVDEAALLAAVRSGQVGMAGLDSFAAEPMAAGHPFQGEKNFVLSPHIGGVTGDAYVNMGVGAAKNVLQVLARQPAATA